MAGHLTPAAKAVQAALDASALLGSAASALVNAIETGLGGPMTEPLAVEVVPRVYVVVQPGGPLDPVVGRVQVMREVS